MTAQISQDWVFHPQTSALMRAVADRGHAIYFVGGCVRNALLDLPVADIDLASDADPETVSDIAKTLGFPVVPMGIDHGTVMVIAGKVALEITTFRRDVATDGRRAVVAYTADMTQDAARRDFTMNALYADHQGRIIDPLGGLPDLLARRVRFVGAPAARIAEDYLRILRFFRFNAVYGDPAQGIDPDGLAACAELADGLDRLSRERIGAEMRKLLTAADPAPTVAAMAQAGILARILPGANPQALAPLVHLEAGAPVSWLRRLAVLAAESPDTDLRLSNVEMRHYAGIKAEIGLSHTPAALAHLHGVAVATDICLVRAALSGQPLPDGFQAELARGAEAQNPVSAADLMPALQGAALGKALRAITERWLASDLRMTKAQLLA